MVVVNDEQKNCPFLRCRSASSAWSKFPFGMVKGALQGSQSSPSTLPKFPLCAVHSCLVMQCQCFIFCIIMHNSFGLDAD